MYNGKYLYILGYLPGVSVVAMVILVSGEAGQCLQVFLHNPATVP